MSQKAREMKIWRRDGFGLDEQDDWLQAEVELRRDAIIMRTTKETD
jgi:hypothetical protein